MSYRRDYRVRCRQSGRLAWSEVVRAGSAREAALMYADLRGWTDWYTNVQVVATGEVVGIKPEEREILPAFDDFKER